MNMKRNFLLGVVATVMAVSAAGCSGCDNDKKKKKATRFECDDPTIAILDVVPSSGWIEEDTRITVLTSGGLVATPQIHTGLEPARNVAWLNASATTAVVTAGLLPGLYDVVVTNPDGTCGVLEDAFSAATEPPPRISTVSPGQIDTSFAGVLTITGLNFTSGATASLVTEALVETPLVVDSLTATTIVASADWNTVGVGAYLVKVTNPDGQNDSYSALGVTNPSGKLGTWEDPGRPLQVARLWPGMTEGRDDTGGRFLYVVGGSNGTGILDSVEVAPTDAFGNLGNWSLASPLNSARSGPGVARWGEWIYVAAGIGTNGALATIERARILPSSESPAITNIVGSGNGALEVGTWYYKVSAVVAGGESVASGEATLLVDDEDGNAISLTWSAVAGATGYRVYRNADLVTAGSGSERFLTQVTGTTFTDDGSLATTSEIPQSSGSLSAWVEDASAITIPRGRLQAEVVDVAGQPFLYVVGGLDGAGFFGTVEFAPINADGSLGAFVESGNQFDSRADFGMAVLSTATVPTFELSPSLAVFSLWAGGNSGGGGGASQIGILDTSATLTFGEVASVVATSNVQTNRVGIALVVQNGFVYAVNGGSHNGTVGSPTDNVSQAQWNPTTDDFGNFSSSATSTNYSRYGAAAVSQGAFMYIAGGLGRDEGVGGAFAPLSSVESVGPGN